MPQVRKSAVNETNRVRIIRSKAFKSGGAKHKRFLRPNVNLRALDGANVAAGGRERENASPARTLIVLGGSRPPRLGIAALAGANFTAGVRERSEPDWLRESH